MSVAVISALVLFAFLVLFGVTIWIDGKKTYILAPKYNHENGDSNSRGENAIAEHTESTETGDMLAKAAVTGSGTASASAELGYEYEHAGEEDIELICELKFSYEISLDADNDKSKANAKVETWLNAESVAIASETIPMSDAESTAKNKGLVKKSQGHAVILKPGGRFNAYLKITAETEGAENGVCNCQVVAKLEEIFYRPKIIVK